MIETSPKAEQVRSALQELLASQGISRSPQLADLLRYVVEKTLAGDGESIKAYSIAVDVFRRPQSFDPQSDPIVRVQARRLRALIDEFYATGRPGAGVEIRLPLGRYAPEFKLVAPQGNALVETAPPTPVQLAGGRGQNGSRFWVGTLLGLSLTLAAAALVISLLRWSNGSNGDAQLILPQTPRVAVGSFENLTGLPALAGEVDGLSQSVSVALARFEDVVVATGTAQADAAVSGVVQESDGRLEMRAVLVQSSTGRAAWNSRITARVEGVDQAALGRLIDQLVRQLTSPRGPLNAAGRTWLAQQAVLPEVPNLYVCQLKYDDWRETRLPVDAIDAIGCFQRLLFEDSMNGLALAGSAGVSSWLTQRQARPGDQLVGLLADESQTTQRAIQLLPNSSFVHEQRAQVLSRQGLPTEALGSISRALELNPNNTDALIIQALFLMLTGEWARGEEISEEVLSTVPSPPPFYYMPRAFNALRERRYFEAVDAAQAFAASGDELAPVLLLAAAPYVRRDDLVERTRDAVLANTDFQAAGILPRLSLYLRQQVVLERIREGLILSGIPANALDGPFNPDGTAKAD